MASQQENGLSVDLIPIGVDTTTESNDDKEYDDKDDNESDNNSESKIESEGGNENSRSESPYPSSESINSSDNNTSDSKEESDVGDDDDRDVNHDDEDGDVGVRSIRPKNELKWKKWGAAEAQLLAQFIFPSNTKKPLGILFLLFFLTWDNTKLIAAPPLPTRAAAGIAPELSSALLGATAVFPSYWLLFFLSGSSARSSARISHHAIHPATAATGDAITTFVFSCFSFLCLL
ncbi:uncharacterized protein HKW66_Vig0145270 [Vigna angularis]|uniref:Uncharacterized protein n=1 Tax=Phaseolus angularis TaxID=3914 RepID=A0A8T0KBM0_PHAAN|nr:uncharacterized protein HKW66_Vig0145270 [Vigna angularis]